MFCEKYYKKLLNYAKKDQIWADPNCPYRGSLCPEARPKAKNPRGRRPRGFLAEGLAEDAAKGLPEENPEGCPQSTPEGTD